MISKPLLVDHIKASLNTQPFSRYLEDLRLSKPLHLDIGAGTGQNVSYTESLGFRSVALEYDPDYASCIPTNQIVRGVADKLPFRSNSFDVITLMHVLEHLPAYKQTLSEIHRVIKPGGLFFVEVPNKYSLQELVNLLYAKYYFDNSTQHLGHCNFFHYSSLKALLEEYRFEIVDIRVTGGLFSSTYNSIAVNFLRLFRKLMKRGPLDPNDYESIKKYQEKLQFNSLMKLDHRINQHTYKFVEFFGFICTANK